MRAPHSFAKPKRDLNNPVSPPARSPAFIPPPITNNVNLNLPLDVILPGADARIEQAQAMVFHAVGDTGGVKGTETQEGLADVMVKQIEDSRANNPPAEEPLFFYHLGDVVNFNGMSSDYPVQFYEPYRNYDAPSPSPATTTAIHGLAGGIHLTRGKPLWIYAEFLCTISAVYF